MERKTEYANSVFVLIFGMIMLLSSYSTIGQNYYPGNRLDYYNMDTTGVLPKRPDYSWIKPTIMDLRESVLRGEKVDVPQFPQETFYAPTLIIPLVNLKDSLIQNIVSERIYMTKKGNFAAYQDSSSHGIFVDITFDMGYCEYRTDTISDYPQLDIWVCSNLNLLSIIDYKKDNDSLFAFYQDSILCVVCCTQKVLVFLATYFSNAFELTKDFINVHCCGRSTFYYSPSMVASLREGRVITIIDELSDGLSSFHYWKNQTWNDGSPYKTDKLRILFPYKKE